MNSAPQKASAGPQSQPQPEPQPVSVPGCRAALFIVLLIGDRPDSLDRVRAWCGDVEAHQRSMMTRAPHANLASVVGFGSQAWDRLFGAPRPAELHPFRELRSDRHFAPSTPGDLLLHLRSERMDVCFEMATRLLAELGDAVKPVDEVHGFRSFDSRASIGFVDGTENPRGQEAVDFTIVGDEDPEFAGGSYVIVQKYLHRMDAWRALPTAEQERVIGRTKYDDIEFSDATKPANAHNAVTSITDENGNELKIVRHNLPFGRPSEGEFGTYFIGYARTPAITERMLRNMFLGDPPGNYDRLLDFSDAVTGGLFFVPSVDLLDELSNRMPGMDDGGASAASPAGDAASGVASDAAAGAERGTDGSLSIGSLKAQSQSASLVANARRAADPGDAD